ncbi:MAG: hypothetical protein ACI97K_002839 [Glaciecola sp.]
MNTGLNISFFKKIPRVAYFPLVFCLSAFILFTHVGTAKAAQAPQAPNDKEPQSVEQKLTTQDLGFSRYEEGEELIFTVMLDKYILGQLIGVTTKDGVAFDLDNYIEILDFPIVKDAEQFYSGWFIQEDYAFQLSVNSLIQGSNNSLNIKGEQQSLNSNEFVFSNDILFVSEASLTRMLGVGHKIDYAAQQVVLLPTELLPLQLRLRRERQNIRNGNFNTPKHPELYRGYELLSPQVFDFQVNSNYRESTDKFNHNYSLLGSRDIALVHADYYLSGNDNDELSRARLKFSTRSSEGDLLGFMGATSVEVGDVRPVRQAYGQSGAESRGVRIANTLLRSSIDNQTMNIQGPIQVGWDAELYRNGVLIDRNLDISVGQYEFLDVPLVFGINEFDVILYGPQGQKVVDKYTKAIDKDILSSRQLTYDFSFNQINESLLGIGDFGNESGFAFSGGIQKSLFESVSLNAGLLSQFGGDTDLNELNLGLNSIVFDRAYVSLNSRFNDNKNRSLSLGVKTRFWDQSLSLQLSNSKSGSANTSDTNNLSFSMSGAIPLFDRLSLSYENEVNYREQNDIQNLRFVNRLGFRYKKVRVFHNFENVKTTDAFGFTKTDYLGALSVGSFFGPIDARFAATYKYDNNEYEPISYQGNFTWHYSNNIKSRLNLRHDIASKINRANLQTGWVSDNFNLSTNIGFSDDLGWDLGLSARFTLLGQAREFNSVYSTEASSTQRGTLTVRVFEDLNTNAIFDEGEPLLSNVKVRALQTFKKGITNVDGIAVLDGMPDQSIADIIIDTDTLPDPFMVSLVPGVSITFRKGLVDKLDYPVSRTAEIEGAVYIVKDGMQNPSKNIPVLLKNARGQIVKTVETEFDGYYVFDKVIPGQYFVEIPKSVFKAKNAHSVASIPIKTGLDSELISGVDFSLNAIKYKTGLVSAHGHYSSLKILEVAKRLLQFKLKGQSPPFFYAKSKNSERYTLVSAFSDDETIVTKVCSLFVQHNLNCKIETMDIPLAQ